MLAHLYGILFPSLFLRSFLRLFLRRDRQSARRFKEVRKMPKLPRGAPQDAATPNTRWASTCWAAFVAVPRPPFSLAVEMNSCPSLIF